MIANKEIKLLDNSQVELTVTVSQADVKKEYDDLLSKYTKDAQIKGFRKGKVPPAILERKFGTEIQAEASGNIMENSLKEIFDQIEEKPLGYSVPEVKNELDFSLDKDFTFTVVYDAYPKFELGQYKGFEIEGVEVDISKEDEERELKVLQEQNAVVVDKASGVVEKDSIVTVNYVELDANNADVAGTAREGFVFTVGTGYNLYKFDDDIIGMKKDEERIITKEYPADFEIKEFAGSKKTIKVKVTAVKEKQLPEINDELAQDISDKYQNLADLVADIRKRLEESAKAKIRERNIDKVLDKILEGTKIDLPRTMVHFELEGSWRNFVARSRMREQDIEAVLGAEGKSKEHLYEEWKPSAERNLKTRIILDRIIKEEKIEVSEQEIEDAIKKQAEEHGMKLEEVKEQYSKNNLMNYLKDDLLDTKVFDFLLENSIIKKGESVKYLDLFKGNQ